MRQGIPPEPLLDQAHLDAQTGGDRALAAELLVLFAQQCRRLMPGIRDASASVTERADLAHTLKGSALGVGASCVATHATEVEDRLRRGEGADRSEAALDEAVETTLAAVEGAN